MHKAALRMAQVRDIHIHVFEEGYLRPDWMTLARDRVIGHSPMEGDPQVIRDAALGLQPIPKLRAIQADFKRRARDSYWHYQHVVTGEFYFPFYTSHRLGSIMLDGIGWALKIIRASRRARQAERTMAAIQGQKYFLFPLHSAFGSMLIATEYFLDSFARSAPDNVVPLIKEHLFDGGYRNWRRTVARLAKKYRIGDRVYHIDGGDLAELSAASVGMVCVNSTSGTLALEVGKPVIALGDAVYAAAGVTHERGIDTFWSNPEPTGQGTWDAFKCMLHAKCLVRGGIAS